MIGLCELTKMDSEESEVKTTSRIPMFDGEKDHWKYYKKKMESHLARLGLSDVLLEANKDKVEFECRED